MYDSLNVLSFLKTCLYIIPRRMEAFFQIWSWWPEEEKKSSKTVCLCQLFKTRFIEVLYALSIYPSQIFGPSVFVTYIAVQYTFTAAVYLSGGSSLFPAVACFFFGIP